MDKAIDKKRREVLEKISRITTMRKGVVSDRVIKKTLRNGDEKINGPYYTLTSKGPKGKTVGENIPADKADFFKSETENYKIFRELSDEYVRLCEQQSKIIATNNVEADKAKKNRKSR
jgi:hypothetical protein